MRQVVIILFAAGLIAYDLFILNGSYMRLLIDGATSSWHAAESFVMAFF